MQGDKASIFTLEQEQGLAQLKRYCPYRIVWGAVNTDTGEYVQGADYTRRRLNTYLRKGWLVATFGG